ncbi:MAG: flavin reductase family protein [Gammaproteobacteria bacterium]|nr:flavin reductase family protein [Gammaproteobacteria bacterium]
MEYPELRRLRDAFGSFLTGITVVTTRQTDGTPRGFTANSFTSVSLNPPMLLVCMDKQAESLDIFLESPGFSISILAENQIDISVLFASKQPDKFEITQWSNSPGGYPIIDGVCAWFDCERSDQVDAGDHVVLFGRILDFDYNSKFGLGYVRGGYMTPGLEYSAGRAYGSHLPVVVGAIVEHEGKILLYDDHDSTNVFLPASGLDGNSGSLQQLQSDLEDRGIWIVIDSLFAVYENEDHTSQSIYYRASVRKVECCKLFHSIDQIPWDRIASKALKSMLSRYLEETICKRFGIYFGSDRNGTIKNLI